jgi:hypothetical protein
MIKLQETERESECPDPVIAGAAGILEITPTESLIIV